MDFWRGAPVVQVSGGGRGVGGSVVVFGLGTGTQSGGRTVEGAEQIVVVAWEELSEEQQDC